MADDDSWSLKEDYHFDLGADCRNIIYHSNLNVILFATSNAEVLVFDVNTGTILHRSCLSGKCHAKTPSPRLFNCLPSAGATVRFVFFISQKTTPNRPRHVTALNYTILSCNFLAIQQLHPNSLHRSRFVNVLHCSKQFTPDPRSHFSPIQLI